MSRTVLIRKFQLHGNLTRMVRATVLSEKAGILRVVPEGQGTPIEVKASDTMDAATTFGTRLGMQHGIVVQKAYPDSPNSMMRICEQRSV